MSTFTPGPWRAHKEEKQEYCRRTGGLLPRAVHFRVQAGEQSVAGLHALPLCGDDEKIVGANARLLAAAPTMYAALESLASSLRTWRAEFAAGDEHRTTILNTLIREADSALARAKWEDA